MGEIVSLIDPAITQNPIEVVIWVKSGVTQQDKQDALTQIEEGLNSWEVISTSRLAFTIVQVVESATQPPVQPHQLLIIMGNAADLTSGGASFPWNGNPGTWFGAVADGAVDLVAVTTHEVGHAIGFHHTAVSEVFPDGTRPVMHWRVAGSSRYPTQDDIAAIAAAYPESTNPLINSTGTIQGRLVMQGTTTPVSGVNVAAVDAVSGDPIVARLSGPRLSSYQDQNAGEFNLVGIPPGQVMLRYLDGNSYRGSMVYISMPSDNNTYAGMRAGYQADNFAEFQSNPINVSAGTTYNIGDVEVPILYMDVDTAIVGELTYTPTEIPIQHILPNASVGSLYEIWLLITGGLRDLSATVTGQPPGLLADLSGDIRSHNVGVHGRHFIHIKGTPNHSGHYTLWAHLIDASGRQRTLPFNLSVEPFETTGQVAGYAFDGNLVDATGSGHDGILVGDAEYTDGVDNGAIWFDGTGYIELPDEEDFDLPEFTIHIVLRLEEPGMNDDWIISKGTRFGNFSLRRKGTSGTWAGYGTYVHETFHGNWSSIASNAPLPTGRFFCLAVSLSETAFKAYIDGQLVRTVANPPAPLFNDDPVIIGGGGYYGVNEYFHGTIDSVQIFRGALSDTEIDNLCPVEPPPVEGRGFRIYGSVVSAKTGRGIPGLRVEAVDKDRIADDRLGAAFTDRGGRFEIRYDREDFQDLFFDRKPDIYLNVYDKEGKLLHTTRDKVRYEANRTEEFKIQIDM